MLPLNTKKMSHILEHRLLPLAENVSNLSILTAVRSALIVTMPFMFLGSLAELLRSFPLPAYKLFMQQHFGDHWNTLSQLLLNGTFSIISLIMLFSIAQHLAEQYNERNPIYRAPPIIVGLVSFISFFCLLPQEGDLFTVRWFGVAGLFVALLVALAATSIFLFFFSFRRLHIHMPGGTPDMASLRAFNALLPGMLTILVFAAVGLVTQSAGTSVHETVHRLIRLPFDHIGDGLGRGMLYILSLHLLWFAGIHGANVLDPITHDIYGAAMLANETAAAAGLPLPHIMTKTFMDTFVFMGGSGSGLCLVGALLLFGKMQTYRKLGMLSLIPGLFNINEVLLFGLPIILNPIMLLPFIGTPLLLAALSYVAVASGLVPGTSAEAVWTTPILLNGYLCTDSLRGPLLQMLNLCVGIMAYAPFVILSNKISMRRTDFAFRRLLHRSCTTRGSAERSIDHHDDAGALARSLIVDLEDAYLDKKGLHLEFQPQVSALTGRVCGVEALLRWRHPFYGSIPAPITVALAEDSRQISRIGLWIFETACRTRRRWLEEGVTDISMAVNFSALQLREELPGQLMEILRRSHVPPSLLELEVTESSALDSDTPESKVLSRLYDLGFAIAVDDFGMGHSSLKYLKQFPVSVVKIDGAISREVLTNPICADIVASITKLCRARGMASVAEFVETPEQARILREQGCDIFQGYLYSKALSADACLEFIRRNHALSATRSHGDHPLEPPHPVRPVTPGRGENNGAAL